MLLSFFTHYFSPVDAEALCGATLDFVCLFYFGINRTDVQTQTCRTGTRHLFLRAIPDVGDCENKYAVQTMSTLTMKLFLSRCPPISGHCKQERREHA